MKHFVLILILFLTVHSIFPLQGVAENSRNEFPSEDQAVSTPPEFFESDQSPMRGIIVRSLYNQDYPNNSGDTTADLHGQAKKIVEFAKEYHYNTLFFEVSPRADAMYRSGFLPASRYMCLSEGNFSFTDPLKIMIEKAKKEKLDVFALISPFYAGEVTDSYSKRSPVTQHPDWFITQGDSLYFDPSNPSVQNYWVNAVKELADKYQISGILFSQIDFPGTSENPHDLKHIEQMIVRCAEAAKQASPELYVGVSASHALIDSPSGQQFLSSVAEQMDYIVPVMDVSVSSPDNYQSYLSRWKDLSKHSKTVLVTQNIAKKVQAPLTEPLIFGDKRELNYQIFANKLTGSRGFILDSYRDTLPYASFISQELNSIPDFKINNQKGTNRSGKIVLAASDPLIFTAFRNYCITGQCDPNLPLFINEQPVQNISKDGYFSVYVPLERGANSFQFRQGDEYEKLMIYMSRKISSAPYAIDDILPQSVFPPKDEILFEGSGLKLSCIAPYGGTVTAHFQGNTYLLSPEKELTEKDVGRPVKYSIEIHPESSDHALTKNLGKVSYTLSYQDFTSKYRSSGEVYLVGSSSRLAVRVDNSFGHVYHTPSKYTAIGNLPAGASDFASLTNNNFFRLQSGGYIHRSDVSIVEGFVDIEKSMETVAIQTNERGENLIFFGLEGVPYHVSFAKESGVLTLKIYNLSNMPKTLSHLSSRLFKEISVEPDEANGALTIKFRLNPSEILWGYHVSYQNGNMVLECRTPPKLESSEKPLSNLCIVIDPGHGGADTGALGVLGKKGLPEKDITLAYAQALRHRLELLGAEVHMTRADDTIMAQEDRVLYSDFKEADFFLAFHLNSTELKDDVREDSGLQVFSNYELSRDFGYLLYHKLVRRLRVTPGGFSSNDLSIVQVPLARSAIILPGNIASPEDYGRIIDPIEIYKTSCLISDSIIQYLSEVEK